MADAILAQAKNVSSEQTTTLDNTVSSRVHHQMRQGRLPSGNGQPTFEPFDLATGVADFPAAAVFPVAAFLVDAFFTADFFADTFFAAAFVPASFVADIRVAFFAAVFPVAFFVATLLAAASLPAAAFFPATFFAALVCFAAAVFFAALFSAADFFAAFVPAMRISFPEWSVELDPLRARPGLAKLLSSAFSP